MRSKPLALAGLLLAAIVPASQAGAEPNGMPYMGGPDNFGEANRQTMAAQVIDPNPTYTAPVPETSGGQAAAAIERYRTDKVKKPERQKTSTLGSNGGGSGGGGGGSGGGN